MVIDPNYFRFQKFKLDQLITTSFLSKGSISQVVVPADRKAFPNKTPSMIQHTPWKSKGILRCFFQVKSNYELTKYQVDTRRSSCQRCCKMLQDGDARMKAIALPRSVQSPNVILPLQKLVWKLRIIMYIVCHHVPNKCFWIASPPKKKLTWKLKITLWKENQIIFQTNFWVPC